MPDESDPFGSVQFPHGFKPTKPEPPKSVPSTKKPGVAAPVAKKPEPAGARPTTAPPGAKAPPRTAADVCKNFKLSAEASPLLTPEQTPRQFLDLLMEKQFFIDATWLWAHTLPKREAIWWACCCVRSFVGATPQPRVAAVLQAAEKWVVDPNDQNRRAAKVAADAMGLDHPASTTALAVFLSGGSLAPPDLPPAPPDEHLSAKAVGGSIILSAVMTEPEKAPEKYRKYLALGIDVGNGKNLWK